MASTVTSTPPIPTSPPTQTPPLITSPHSNMSPRSPRVNKGAFTSTTYQPPHSSQFISPTVKGVRSNPLNGTFMPAAAQATLGMSKAQDVQLQLPFRGVVGSNAMGSFSASSPYPADECAQEPRVKKLKSFEDQPC